MLKRIALVVALLQPTSVAAKCHHFRVWRYPYPQTCRNTALEQRVDRSWYVEFVFPTEHELGVELLKKQQVNP